jgi:hypothetical protein
MVIHPRNSRIADASAEIFDRSFSRDDKVPTEGPMRAIRAGNGCLARAGDYEPPSLVLTLVKVVEAFVPTA